MTTLQQIQREVKTLPEYARKEVFDFVLFLKEKEQKTRASTCQPPVRSETEQAQKEWIDTLPEMLLSLEAQTSLANSRKAQGTEMTIEEFQTYLKNANV